MLQKTPFHSPTPLSPGLCCGPRPPHLMSKYKVMCFLPQLHPRNEAPLSQCRSKASYCRALFIITSFEQSPHFKKTHQSELPPISAQSVCLQRPTARAVSQEGGQESDRQILNYSCGLTPPALSGALKQQYNEGPGCRDHKNPHPLLTELGN